MHQHDKSIICFKHCSSTSIFCKQVPQRCPTCNIGLVALPLEPVVIPYPLTSALDSQCCIVIRPTEGCFLCDYSINHDLHIGVTNSEGFVIEYDKCGLVKNDNDKWNDCISIQLIPHSWQLFWDEMLSNMCNDSMWCAANYDDVKFNCFTFVTSFLRNLNYKDAQFTSKEDICESLILPKIQIALKYATIHRHLMNEDFYSQE